MFCNAVLSSHDARPRGGAGIDSKERDDFTVADFMDHLRYERAKLRFASDYIRGRCIKTDDNLGPDGPVTIETRDRGESATRRLQVLQGRKHLEPTLPRSFGGGQELIHLRRLR